MSRMQYRESEELRNIRKSLRKYYKGCGAALDKALDYYVNVLDSDAQDSVKANAASKIVSGAETSVKMLKDIIKDREEASGLKSGSISKAIKNQKQATNAQQQYDDTPDIVIDEEEEVVVSITG